MLIFDYTLVTEGSWKSCFKIFEFKCLKTKKRDVSPKQRYNRFPSVGGHIYATTNLEDAWATPGHFITESS